jgi:hypothetical protein
MKQITNYPNYYVSLDGKVFSLLSMKWLKPRKTGNKYCQVQLFNDKGYKYLLVHRLVAETYLINNEVKKTVNHLDGDKLNNSLLNLQWSTHSENLKHAFKNGLKFHNKNQRTAISNVGKRVGRLNGIKSADKKKKLILNEMTGIYYNGLEEAAYSINVDKTKLCHIILGNSKIKTSLKYV